MWKTCWGPFSYFRGFKRTKVVRVCQWKGIKCNNTVIQKGYDSSILI